jgi:hypothetical protein
MDGGAMRQPRKDQRKRADQWAEDPDLGTIMELEPIEVEGSVSRANAIELDPIDVQGSRSANVQPFAERDGFVPGSDARRRPDGVSTMLPEWVPSWATQIVGQPVRGMGDETDWEFAPLIAELLADDQGQMPRSVMDVGAQIARNVYPGQATDRMFRGVAPTAEERTFNPLSAALGFADTGSAVLNAGARLAGEDNFIGLFDDGTAVEGADWTREMQTAQRQDPGSFAGGELASVVSQLPVPSMAAGRGATTAARAGYTALEGAAYGGIEGMARSNAPTLSGQLQDAARGAAGGAVLGGGLSYAGSRAAARAEQPVDQRAVDQAMSDANLEWAAQAGAAQSRKRMRTLLGGTAEQQIQNAEFMGAQMRDLGVTAPRRPATRTRAAGILPPTGRSKSSPCSRRFASVLPCFSERRAEELARAV